MKLYNVGARPIEHADGTLRPKGNAVLDTKEAEKLLRLFPNELHDVEAVDPVTGKQHEAEVDKLEIEIKKLKAENKVLKDEVEELKTKVEDLETTPTVPTPKAAPTPKAIPTPKK